MSKTIFSMNDAYPNGSDSNVQTVSEQTIPTHDEANYNIDNQTAVNGNGATKTTDGNMIWGALLLLLGLLVVLHFLN